MLYKESSIKSQSKKGDRMKHRRRRGRWLGKQDLFIDSASRERVEYWVLTLLISMNGHRDFFSSMGGFTDDSIAYFLGLDKYVDDSEAGDRKDIQRSGEQT